MHPLINYVVYALRGTQKRVNFKLEETSLYLKNVSQFCAQQDFYVSGEATEGLKISFSFCSLLVVHQTEA